MESNETNDPSQSPPPPDQPPAGTWGTAQPSPPPAGTAPIGELPRIGSARSGGSRPGSGGSASGRQYPRSSSAGDIRPPTAGNGTIERSNSQGSVRPPSGGGLGPRNPSREQLQPLPPGAAALPLNTEALDGTPRSGGQPRLAPLAGGSRPPSSGGSGDRGVPPLRLNNGGDRQIPPVPAPHPAAAARVGNFAGNQVGNQADNNAATQRGPVRWVPHTHANPKHAKYCFICLHGKLEGDADGGVGADLVQQRMDEDDLPSSIEMKELSYLLPGTTDRFTRTNANYDIDNITAVWMRGVSNTVYNETVRGLVAEQNALIHSGGDAKIVDDREDDKDRAALARLFELSNEEQKGVINKLEKLATWCQAQEARLQDVMPKKRESILMPEVEPPNEVQKALLEYKPLIDVSKLKGDSAAEVRDVIRQADAAIGTTSLKGSAETFQVNLLPRPNTHPDMPDFKILPYPLSLKDIPKYEYTPPSDTVRQPIDAILDPFPRAFLHIPEFHESIMPEFKGAVGYEKPRHLDVEAAKDEEWLSKTRSIFVENNEDVEGPDWGKVPPRDRPKVPLIDEPYQPPPDLLRGPTGQREIKIRSIWDPELLVRQCGNESAADPVPPVRQRGKDLYVEAPYEHPEQPIWSAGLAPPKTPFEKVSQMCKIVPVRSFARFKPKKLHVDIPDFLWSLAREDASGQTLWSVVEQRHDVPARLRAEEEAFAEEQRLLAEQEMENIRRTTEMEEEALRRKMAGEDDDDESGDEEEQPTEQTNAPAQLSADSGATQLALPANTNMPGLIVEGRAVEEIRDGMPVFQVDAPDLPQQPPMPTMPRADQPSSNVTTSRPATSGPNAIATAGTVATQRRPSKLAAHEERVQNLTAPSGTGGRSVEDLLKDETFVDTIAEKIAMKLGGPTMGSTFYPGGTQTSFGPAGTGKRLRPDPPSFAEPVDAQSRAELPRALQGGAQKKGFDMPDAPKPVTVVDVNHFTMEKMRGECYVRLLTNPEANAAKKNPVPYQGAPVLPDTTLVMGAGRPNLRMPPRPPTINDDGDLVQDDEFVEFDTDNSIIFSFVRHNRYESIEKLIQSDPSVLNAKDEHGNSLLHIACQNNNRRIAKLLLKNDKSMVNEQNNRGNTALHYCYAYGFMPLCDYLIRNDADDSIPNNENFVPMQGIGRDDDVGVAQQRMRATGDGL